MSNKTILIVGTYDTKNDELEYLVSRIKSMGGNTLTMDVSVLGDPKQPTDISKHEVAEAGNGSIQLAIDFNSENKAMQMMAEGSSKLTLQLQQEGRIDGVLVLGGTMATDLALDVCRILPIGVPKYVISTVAFSPLIEPGRLAADIQMILWAGGLYGLNSVCKSSLSQAAGAVLGAANAVEAPTKDRPMIGMTSLGNSCLKYMKKLKPELEDRGFDVAIFHSTGMGGMAYESIAKDGGFACVMDFSMQELTNLIFGSIVNSGPDRLLSAGRVGIPQMVAPGAMDIVDFAGWQEIPEKFKDRPLHEHNRLIKSSGLNPEERRETARELCKRVSQAKAPVHVFLPTKGIQEWDREGGDTRDTEGLAVFCDEIVKNITTPVKLTKLDVHINDQEFCDEVLKVFDQWLLDGIVKA